MLISWGLEYDDHIIHELEQRMWLKLTAFVDYSIIQSARHIY